MELKLRAMKTLVCGITGAVLTSVAQGADSAKPKEEVYSRVGERELKAYIFEPANGKNGKPVAAVVVFHGGGWVRGNGSWSFEPAQRFAELGMVGIGIEYRLSDRKSVTPLEAMADARAAMRWVRSNAETLGIDPK